MTIIYAGGRDAHKTGERNRGVNTTPRKIQEVTDVVCPQMQGRNHEIANTRAGASRCIGCNKSWAQLDLELNGPR